MKATILATLLIIPMFFLYIDFTFPSVIFKNFNSFLNKRNKILILVLLLILLLFLYLYICSLENLIGKRSIIEETLTEKLEAQRNLSSITNSTVLVNRRPLQPVNSTGFSGIFLKHLVKIIFANDLIGLNLRVIKYVLIYVSMDYMNNNNNHISSLIINQYQNNYQIKLELKNSSFETLNALDLAFKNPFFISSIERTLEGQDSLLLHSLLSTNL